MSSTDGPSKSDLLAAKGVAFGGRNDDLPHLVFFFANVGADCARRVLYWLPTIIALFRQSDARLGIALLFGWAFLGWVGALAWATRRPLPAALPAELLAP